MERMYIVVRHSADFPTAVADCWDAVGRLLAEIDPAETRRWRASGAGKIAVRARPAQWEALTDEIESFTSGVVRAYRPVPAPEPRFRKLQAHSPATELVLPNAPGDVEVLLNQSLDLSSGKWLAHVGHASAAAPGRTPSFSWASERSLRNAEGGTLVEDAGHTEVAPGTPTVWIGP